MVASLIQNAPYLIGTLALLVPIYAWLTFARTPKGRR